MLSEKVRIFARSLLSKTETELTKLIRWFLKKNIETSGPGVDFLSGFQADKKSNVFDPKELIYFDETWEKILNRWKDRRRAFWGQKIYSKDNACKNSKVKFIENNLIIRSKNIKDDWIYMIGRRKFRNFSLIFDATFFTEFQEIQFGFRHVDFYNRYRFRIQEGKLFFDVVFRGKFFNSLEFAEFKPELGRKYQIQVLALERAYCFRVDGKPVLAVREKLPVVRNGTYAIILWDSIGSSNIAADYANIQLSEI